MSPIRSIRHRSSAPILLIAAAALALGGGLVSPARAQAQEEPAPADEAPAAKAKPRPKKPPPKKPVEAKPAEAEKPADKAAGARPNGEAPLLEPAAGEAAAQWPNGARSVSESYGDWTMNCNREGAQTDCVVIQSQGDRRTSRRQFSVELRAPRDGRAEGLILMPFGMQIEPGVTFKLDDRTLGKGAPYSYCVNDGCLVPISLPTLATDAMRTAQALTISAMKPDAKEPTVISVPLTGFASAFARAAAFGG